MLLGERGTWPSIPACFSRSTKKLRGLNIRAALERGQSTIHEKCNGVSAMSAASSRYGFNRSVSLLLENLAAKRQLIGLLCSVTTIIQGEDLSYSQMRYFYLSSLAHGHTLLTDCIGCP